MSEDDAEDDRKAEKRSKMHCRTNLELSLPRNFLASHVWMARREVSVVTMVTYGVI